MIADRLRRIYSLAIGTGHLARFVIFGSYVTGTPEPNDVDVFLLMGDLFDADKLRGEAAILFNHPWAQASLAPAYSGCGGWPLLVASRRQLSTGRSSATAAAAGLWRWFRHDSR